MTRYLLLAATLVALGPSGCSGSDEKPESSCPDGLTCDNPGGAGSGTSGTGGADSSTGGTPGATGGFVTGSGGAATGGIDTGSGGTATGGTGGNSSTTLPERCSQIDGATAQSLVAQDAVLVDVRLPDDYAAGHIEGAINIPLGELPNRLDGLPTDGPIVVYCQSGNRSAHATTILCDAGMYVLDLGAMSNYPS